MQQFGEECIHSTDLLLFLQKLLMSLCLKPWGPLFWGFPSFLLFSHSFESHLCFRDQPVFHVRLQTCRNFLAIWQGKVGLLFFTSLSDAIVLLLKNVYWPENYVQVLKARLAYSVCVYGTCNHNWCHHWKVWLNPVWRSLFCSNLQFAPTMSLWQWSQIQNISVSEWKSHEMYANIHHSGTMGERREAIFSGTIDKRLRVSPLNNCHDKISQAIGLIRLHIFSSPFISPL